MHNKNELCPCGSEKKYKHCCLKTEQKESIENAELILYSTTRNKIKYVATYATLMPLGVVLIIALVSNSSDRIIPWKDYLDLFSFIFMFALCLCSFLTVLRNTKIKLNPEGIYYTKFPPFGSEKHIPWYRVKGININSWRGLNAFEMKFKQECVESKKLADYTESVALDFIDASKDEILNFVSLMKPTSIAFRAQRDLATSSQNSKQKKRHKAHLSKSGPLISGRVKAPYGKTNGGKASSFQFGDRGIVSIIAIVLSPLSIFMFDYQYWYLWEYGEFRSFGEGDFLVVLALANLAYCLFVFPYRTIVDLKRDISAWGKAFHCINALLFFGVFGALYIGSLSMGIVFGLLFSAIYAEVHLQILRTEFSTSER